MAREIIFPSRPVEAGTPVSVAIVASQPDGSVQVATVDDWNAPKEDQVAQFVELDRRQINKLIKALRAARHRAYGRDE